MRKKRAILQNVAGDIEVTGGRELRLTFHAEGDHPIPALLLLPATSITAPAPAVLMLHGYSSRKEEIAGPLGHALLGRGIASLSIDLPLHGTRADPVQAQAARHPIAMMQLWRQALADARLALRYLAARHEVDRDRIGLVGYSMGAYLSVSIAPDEPLVRALVLAAGGALPEGSPIAGVARMVADPVRAVRRLGGRPLLMVNGRHDRTITPAQAQRLFDAAVEPKEMRWYESGHYLPVPAIRDVTRWLGDTL